MDTYLIIKILFGISILTLVVSICVNIVLMRKMKMDPLTVQQSDLRNLKVVTTPVSK